MTDSTPTTPNAAGLHAAGLHAAGLDAARFHDARGALNALTLQLAVASMHAGDGPAAEAIVEAQRQAERLADLLERIESEGTP